jgi:hypothetical protein
MPAGAGGSPHVLKRDQEASVMPCWSYRTARVLLLGALVGLQGCMFTTLRDELTEMERVHGLTGRIFNQTRPETSVLLVLYQQTPGGLEISSGEAGQLGREDRSGRGLRRPDPVAGVREQGVLGAADLHPVGF